MSARGSSGAGRFGLDFWNVIDNKRTRENIYNRWPHSSCAQREPTVFRMAYPGPSGPLPSLRFECLRQGVQEADETGQNMLFNILLSIALITPIVAFYLLLDWDRLVARLDSWLPRRHADTRRHERQQPAGFLVKGQEIGVPDLVLAVHLLDQQLAIALDVQCVGLEFGGAGMDAVGGADEGQGCAIETEGAGAGESDSGAGTGSGNEGKLVCERGHIFLVNLRGKCFRWFKNIIFLYIQT